jgi:hypothetical protein
MPIAPSPESVILTRRRGDAETGAEKQRESETERGDSGVTWPSVRRGRVPEEEITGSGSPRLSPRLRVKITAWDGYVIPIPMAPGLPE